MPGTALRARFPDLWTPRGVYQSPFQIDDANPLSRELVGYWRGGFLAPAGGLTNLVSGVRAAPNSTQAAPGVGADGVFYETIGNGGIFANGNENLGNGVAFTLAARLTVTSLTGGAGLVAVRNVGTLRNALLFTGSNTTPRYQVSYGAGAQNVDDTADRIANVGDAITIVATSRSQTDHEVYVDGVSRATSTADAGSSSGGRTAILIGQTAGGNGRNNIRWYWLAAWFRGMDADEARWLHEEPTALLRPAV